MGTGEANGSADSFAGVGIYRIDNADTTATLVAQSTRCAPTRMPPTSRRMFPAFNGRSISRILVHPTNPGLLFVGTAGGVIGMGGDGPLAVALLPPLGMRGCTA